MKHTVHGFEMLELAAEADDDVLVRRPRQTDEPMLTEHFLEMQAHYGRPVPLSQAMEAARIACRPAVHSFDPRVIVALKDEAIVGSIVLNVMFPAFELTKSLYIRDLYVTATRQALRWRGGALSCGRQPACCRRGVFGAGLDHRDHQHRMPARCMRPAAPDNWREPITVLADEELMLYAGG